MILHSTVPSTTAARRTQRDALPSRELLVHALDAAGAISCRVYADDFTIAAIDDTVQTLTGIAPSRWSEETFWDRHLHPDDHGILDEARRGTRTGVRNVSVAFRIVDDGAWISLRFVGRRADREQGRPVIDGFLIVTSAGLSGPGAEDGALQQARRDLVRSSQLSVAGALVGAITHDLRQPLTALAVNLEVAMQVLGNSPPAIDVAIDALRDAADDGGKLRDSLQVLHNLVTHKQPIQRTFTMDSIVRDVARLVQPEADARHVQLAIVIRGSLPPISGDPTMLREAILSVVLDAVENTTSTVVPALVRLDVHPLPDGRVEVVVSHERSNAGNDENAWALRVARSVADAHGATVQVEAGEGSILSVRTIWPAGLEQPLLPASAQ